LTNQPEAYLVEIAIEDRVDVSLGDGRHRVGGRIGCDTFDHFCEIVTALGYGVWEVGVSSGGCFEKFLERDLFTHVPQGAVHRLREPASNVGLLWA